jgi:hypothetical protein
LLADETYDIFKRSEFVELSVIVISSLEA